MLKMEFIKRLTHMGFLMISLIVFTGCDASKTYEVVFVVGDTETVVTVEHGEHVEIPNVLIPEGYEIDGW